MKPWSDLKTSEREPYLEAAAKLLYPDLRQAYKDNNELRHILARNLFYAHQEGKLTDEQVGIKPPPAKPRLDLLPVKWRWHSEQYTKIVLGFAMDINKHLKDIDDIESFVTDMLTGCIRSGAFPDKCGTFQFGTGGIMYQVLYNALDGFPFTVKPVLDLSVLLVEPPKYACKAHTEYEQDTHNFFAAKKELIDKYKDTELHNPHPCWRP